MQYSYYIKTLVDDVEHVIEVDIEYSEFIPPRLEETVMFDTTPHLEFTVEDVVHWHWTRDDPPSHHTVIHLVPQNEFTQHDMVELMRTGRILTLLGEFPGLKNPRRA